MEPSLLCLIPPSRSTISVASATMLGSASRQAPEAGLGTTRSLSDMAFGRLPSA